MVHHVTPLGHNSREPIPTSLPRNLVMGHSSMYQVSADTRMYLRCSAAFSEPDDSHTAGMQTGSVTSISRRFLLSWQTAIKTYAGPFMSHAAGDCRPRPHRIILTGAAIVYGSRAPSAERTQAPNAAMVGKCIPSHAAGEWKVQFRTIATCLTIGVKLRYVFVHFRGACYTRPNDFLRCFLILQSRLTGSK